MTDRKNIKVREDLFERLKADKGPHRSWPQYLEDQLSDDTPETDGVEVGDLQDRLERIEAMTKEATNAAQSAEAKIERLQ